MSLIRRFGSRIGFCALALAATWLTSCQQFPWFGAGCYHEGDGCPERGRACLSPTVRALAGDIKDLEMHIERNGSVVASQPSVWGQARLTKHREEFEQQMSAQLSKFDATLQGSLSRSDQAYAANAFALAMTAQAVAGGGSGSSTSSSSSSSSSGPTVPALSADLKGTFGAFDNITRNPAHLANPIGFATIGQRGLSLEPTTYLDQMKRYLDHLNELRRINEGDDTADSPGYSLNLIRVPVSVMPGQHTVQGHGAEITLTLRPHLHEELLPMTFRNLVINDLLEQIGAPLTGFLNHIAGRAAIYESAYFGDPEPDDKKFVQGRLQSADTRQLMELLLSRMANPNYKSLRNDYDLVVKAIKEKPDWFAGSAVPLNHRGKRPYPPSQSADVIGKEEWLSVATQISLASGNDLANRDVIHYTDVQAYLQDELQAAYHFLRDPRNQDLWDHCHPNLASAIRARRTGEVANRRGAFQQCVQKLTHGDAAKETTMILAWAIIVDAALLNEQLVEDMKNSASARGVNLPTEWMPYFLPYPTPEARRAFADYVNCRWPIHVFALDPAADQQNIADTFSSRREMQLAMSLAFMSGNLSANNLMRFARRIEMEAETIALNNTAVGFSHGAETFGWRFYPRFQTPDIEGNATVIFRDLLLGGPKRNALLRHNRLEPGVRECVAIVLMPSFVPYADLDANSNFFRLDNPKCKVMDTVESVRLSGRVKTIQNCGPRVQNANCYRDGELEGLMRRADQLEARLPRQRMSVQVPYENTLGGFAMFNTGITDLAPELLGWYGAPAINLDGSTTIFLIGNHFSVHQTRILAGGQEVGTSEMLSRQVMKVTIPANAMALVQQTGFVSGGYKMPYPALKAKAKDPVKKAPSDDATAPAGTTPVTMDDGSSVFLGPEYLFVDIQVATPYGVSAHLLVPAVHLAKTGGSSAGGGVSGGSAVAATEAGWSTKELTLSYTYQGLGIALSGTPAFQPKELTFNLGPKYSLATGSKVTLKMKLGSGATGALPNLDIPVTATNFDAKKHTLKVSGADLANLVASVIGEVQYQFGPEPTKPPVGFAISETTVTVTGMPDAKLTTPLKVSWIKGASPSVPTVGFVIGSGVLPCPPPPLKPPPAKAMPEATWIAPPPQPVPAKSSGSEGPSPASPTPPLPAGLNPVPIPPLPLDPISTKHIATP